MPSEEDIYECQERIVDGERSSTTDARRARIGGSQAIEVALIAYGNFGHIASWRQDHPQT
jgi:hypothetical protein